MVPGILKMYCDIEFLSVRSHLRHDHDLLMRYNKGIFCILNIPFSWETLAEIFHYGRIKKYAWIHVVKRKF